MLLLYSYSLFFVVMLLYYIVQLFIFHFFFISKTYFSATRQKKAQRLFLSIYSTVNFLKCLLKIFKDELADQEHTVITIYKLGKFFLYLSNLLFNFDQIISCKRAPLIIFTHMLHYYCVIRKLSNIRRETFPATH